MNRLLKMNRTNPTAAQHVAIALALLTGCVTRAATPDVPLESDLGRCSAGFDTKQACGAWDDAVAACAGDPTTHTSFPELSDKGCFVPVHDNGIDLPRAGITPKNCGFPTIGSSPATAIRAEAKRLDAIAQGSMASLPMYLDCNLPGAVRGSAARTNARTLRSLATRIERGGKRWPYALASTFGFGNAIMNQSRLVSWRPGDGCMALDKPQMRILGINTIRAGRVAAAYHGNIAPVVSVSGSAVHASLYEAFMHMHLLTCQFDVPSDAVLLDPCADHTHTNFRNTGSLVKSVGGRTAYVVTQGFQAGYLQDATSFGLFGGDIDQRAKRDWGYLLGSWHQASVGHDDGFWFTPYRFWGEPPNALGSFSCVK